MRQMIPLAPLLPSSSYDQLVNKGRRLVNKERSEEAVAVFDRAVALEPKQTHAIMNRAVAWQLQEKLNQALSVYFSAGP